MKRYVKRRLCAPPFFSIFWKGIVRSKWPPTRVKVKRVYFLNILIAKLKVLLRNRLNCKVPGASYVWKKRVRSTLLDRLVDICLLVCIYYPLNPGFRPSWLDSKDEKRTIVYTIKHLFTTNSIHGCTVGNTNKRQGVVPVLGTLSGNFGVWRNIFPTLRNGRTSRLPDIYLFHR